MRSSKRYLILIHLLVGLLVVLAACTGETGSGDVVTENIVVSDFDAVALAGIGDVVIEQAAQPSLTVSTDDNFLDNIDAQVADGTLRVETSNIVNPADLTFRIGAPGLERVSAARLSEVTLLGVDLDELVVSVRDGASVVATGQVDRLEVQTADTAGFDGSRLAVTEANVNAGGVSNVVVQVGESLTATTHDTASIRYSGNPAVQADTADGGQVQAAE